MSAPTVFVEAIECRERPVRLRLPFRFGVVTLRHAPQAFVRVRIRLAESGAVAWGASAEMMIPKWFDKDPALANDDNFEQLRRSLGLARDAYLSAAQPATAFGHHARHYRAVLAAGAAGGLNALVASYGMALVDRAIIDALARGLGLSFFDVFRANLAGFRPALLLPEFAGFDADAFLAGLRPLTAVAARHTVGLADPITAAEDGFNAIGDGLPQTLDEVIARYGHHYFKIKVGGDVDTDCARIARIAAVLDARCGDYRITLDGNEQYDDGAGIAALWRALHRAPELARFRARVLWIEQPIARSRALSLPLPDLGVPVVIDESDGDLDAFPVARALGYRGVSSKSCKGIYKSLINLARTRRWNAASRHDPYFIAAEDLTMQAGIAVQQDLALVALLGIPHVERNGHHYVNGMADLPAREQQDFLAAHPDLYEASHGATRLRIRDGMLAIGSLGCPGFAAAAEPVWASMTEMQIATNVAA